MNERAREQAERVIGRRRQLAERERDRRVAAAFERCPELAALEAEIRSFVFAELAQAAVDGDYSFQALQQKLAERGRLLAACGLAPDYDEPRYTCRRCNDEGIVDGRLCRCRRELEAALLPQLFDVTLDEHASFETFDPSVFRAERQNGEPLSPREQMQALADIAADYTENFQTLLDRDLYFYGKQGTGKTFLVSAIGNEMVRRGVDVLYLPALHLFDSLFFYRRLRESFRPDPDRLAVEEERREAIYTSTLLIIDDLGTETPREQGFSDFLDLLNVRRQQKRYTVVASNQSLSDLRRNYDVRIASRLGAFTAYYLFGDDVRLSLSGNVEHGR